MSRFLDPVPLLLGGLVGAIVGGIASWTIEGRVDWALVVALLVATLVTSVAMLIGAGPTRGMGWRTYSPEQARWRFRGGAVPMPPGQASTGHVAARPVFGGQGPFDRFDDSGKRTLALAQDEAIRFNHNYIGTEHLLLGLMRNADSVAGRALTALGVDLSKVRTAVEFIIGRGASTTVPSDITLSPRTKKIIELAIDEARGLDHAKVGAGHLLLGLVREGEGIGAGVLQSLGIEFATVRAKVIELMAEHEPPAAPPPQTPPAGPGA